MERLQSISSYCKQQPPLCHSHHQERPPSHSKILLSGVLQKSRVCYRKYCPHCTRQATSIYLFLVILPYYVYTFVYVGLLYPVGPTTVQYNTSDTVILQVNITPTATFKRDYLRALTWYHNGVEIIPGSRYYYSNYNYYYRYYTLSSDNTTLTITNAQRSDAGVYHVQFAGLRIYPYNKLCEEETLALLRHYPLLSPVVFSVYTNGKLTNKYPCYPYRLSSQYIY